MRQLAIFVFLTLGVLCAPSVALCDDLDDLKATHEQYRGALNAKDADALAAHWHDGGVYYLGNAAFAVDIEALGRAAWLSNVKSTFADFERFSVVGRNLQYRVIGETGIVWGHSTITIKRSDGPQEARHYRVTTVYTKSDGAWKIVNVHVSAIPSGG